MSAEKSDWPIVVLCLLLLAFAFTIGGWADGPLVERANQVGGADFRELSLAVIAEKDRLRSDAD